MTAVQFLTQAADPGQHAADRKRVVLAYGILWADTSCRISGTLAVTLHRATAAAGEALLERLIQAGLDTTGDVPYWLNAHQQEALEILS